jgi:hypothetical protein
MFARVVLIKSEHDGEARLSRILEQEAIPRFQQNKDFLGLLAFISMDGLEALSLSLWNQEKGKGADCPSDLSELTTLARLFRGAPTAQVYKVSKWTLRTMTKMLGQKERIQSAPDLDVYHACSTAFPLVARTMHAELKFPSREAPYEFNP